MGGRQAVTSEQSEEVFRRANSVRPGMESVREPMGKLRHGSSAVAGESRKEKQGQTWDEIPVCPCSYTTHIFEIPNPYFGGYAIDSSFSK